LSRHRYNIEDLLSKFETRIDEDVRRGTLQRDDQLLERYRHHFRTTLEEDGVTCGLVRHRHSKKDRETKIISLAARQDDSSHLNTVSSIDRGNPQISLQGPETREFESPFNNRMRENSREEISPSDSWNAPALSNPNTIESTVDFSPPTQPPTNPPIPDLSSCRQSGLPIDFSSNPEESSLSQLCGYDPGTEAADFPEFSMFAEPEAPRAMSLTFDLQPEQPPFDYYIGDDPLTNLLHLENEMPEATGPWKDKHSGSRFLRQR
jgi:hypothetical protein